MTVNQLIVSVLFVADVDYDFYNNLFERVCRKCNSYDYHMFPKKSRSCSWKMHGFRSEWIK